MNCLSEGLGRLFWIHPFLSTKCIIPLNSFLSRFRYLDQISRLARCKDAPCDNIAPHRSNIMTHAIAFHGVPLTPGAHSFDHGSNCSGRSIWQKRRKRRDDLAFNIPPYLKDLFSNPLRREKTTTVSALKVLDRQKIPLKLITDLENRILGRRFTKQELLFELEPIVEWCKSQGYTQSGITIHQMPTRKDPTLILKCVEPILSRVKLVVLNPENVPDASMKPKTKPGTIAHILGMSIGNTFRWDKRGFDRLAASGIVEYATVELEIVSPEEVEAIVYLRERLSGHFEPGIAISADGKVEADVSLVDNNFRGLGQRVRAVWKRRMDKGKMSGGLEFDNPRVGSTVPLTYKFRLYRDAGSDRTIHLHDGRNTQEYLNSIDESVLVSERDRNGALFDLKYQPTPFSVFSIGPVVEKVLGRGREPGENQILITATAKNETARPFNSPHSGHSAKFEYSIGARLSERNTSKTPFQRGLVYLAQYFELGKMCILALRGQIGLGSGNLPYWEQTLLGGARTLRGFTYGELGRAGNHAAGRVELRFPFDRSTSPVKAARKGIIARLPSLVGVVFGDVAAVLEPFEMTTGVSLGVAVRIGGLLNLEYCVASHGREPLLRFGLLHREF